MPLSADLARFSFLICKDSQGLADRWFGHYCQLRPGVMSLSADVTTHRWLPAF